LSPSASDLIGSGTVLGLEKHNPGCLLEKKRVPSRWTS
jgi:hypothetical protein